jgi:hypothetical protein
VAHVELVGHHALGPLPLKADSRGPETHRCNALQAPIGVAGASHQHPDEWKAAAQSSFGLLKMRNTPSSFMPGRGATR